MTRWTALALVRLGDALSGLAQALLRDPDRDWRRRAALVASEQGDARGCDEIAAWWDALGAGLDHGNRDGEPPRLGMELPRIEELLAATGKARCRSAEPSLARALADVRVRPFAADTLGTLGDERAREPLLSLFADEPYVSTRPHEARALMALGASAWSSRVARPSVDVTLSPPRGANRLLVLLSEEGAAQQVAVNGRPHATSTADGEVAVVDLGSLPPRASLHLGASRGGILGIWLVVGRPT